MMNPHPNPTARTVAQLLDRGSLTITKVEQTRKGCDITLSLTTPNKSTVTVVNMHIMRKDMDNFEDAVASMFRVLADRVML